MQANRLDEEAVQSLAFAKDIVTVLGARRLATIEFQDITAYYVRYDNTSGTSEHQITARKRRSGLARAQKGR